MSVSHTRSILTLKLRFEQDIVLARQRARQVADLLGFETQDQTHIATATSEMARNALVYAGGGTVEFLVEGVVRPQTLLIRICDRGPGIVDVSAVLEGRHTSGKGMGLGLLGTRRLMDRFHMESVSGGGTTVELGKILPARVPVVSGEDLVQVADRLASFAPQSSFEEVRQQNRELLRTLEELRQRQEDLIQLNRELDDTNRGVVALYAELDEKARQVQQRSEEKSRSLSSMSHELRTPLNSILALSRILLDRIGGELTAEQEKQVTFIRKAGESLSQLVNDLLDIAKIEAGKIEVYPVAFKIEDLFGALKGMMKALAAHPSVELIFEDPVGVPPLHTDESKVSQILRNLISNGLKFTEQGEVRVSAKLDAGGEHVVFSVSDTGIGIAAEDQERIFEEYVQIPSALQGRVKGTGLGLALSRRLADVLGGRLWVESEPGVGSTFTAVIPSVYAEPSPDVPVWKAPHGAPTPAQEEILIIDDQEVSRYLFKQVLLGTRYTVLEAGSGSEGLRRAREEQPQVVFLDLVMSGMDGFEILARLKSDAVTRDIPVIIYTSKDLGEEEHGHLMEGAVAVLSKQRTSREEILGQIREALVQAGARPSSRVAKSTGHVIGTF